MVAPRLFLFITVFVVLSFAEFAATRHRHHRDHHHRRMNEEQSELAKVPECEKHPRDGLVLPGPEWPRGNYEELHKELRKIFVSNPKVSEALMQWAKRDYSKIRELLQRYSAYDVSSYKAGSRSTETLLSDVAGLLETDDQIRLMLEALEEEIPCISTKDEILFRGLNFGSDSPTLKSLPLRSNQAFESWTFDYDAAELFARQGPESTVDLAPPYHVLRLTLPSGSRRIPLIGSRELEEIVPAGKYTITSTCFVKKTTSSGEKKIFIYDVSYEPMDNFIEKVRDVMSLGRFHSQLGRVFLEIWKLMQIGTDKGCEVALAEFKQADLTVPEMTAFGTDTEKWNTAIKEAESLRRDVKTAIEQCFQSDYENRLEEAQKTGNVAQICSTRKYRLSPLPSTGWGIYQQGSIDPVMKAECCGKKQRGCAFCVTKASSRAWCKPAESCTGNWQQDVC